MSGPYRSGPWPSLTPRGAGVLLGCALLLGIVELVVGEPHRALPDLPVLGVIACVPMLLATRIVKVPGAGSAVCGAYLLPRTLISLVVPSIEPPPLLVLPALAFDVALWLRAADLALLMSLRPWRQVAWRKRRAPVMRRMESWRAAVAGGVFGVVLTLVEPPFALLLGADPSAWSEVDTWRAGGLTVFGCAVVALVLSVRGRAS